MLTVPKDDVFVLYVLLALDPSLDALGAPALIGEFACGVQFIVLVLGDPDRLGGKLSTAEAVGILTDQKHLAGSSHKLVCNRLVGNWVGNVVIADLEDAVAIHAGVRCACRAHHGRLRGIAHKVGVLLVFWHRNAVLVVDGVLKSINSRVNPQGEHMLVEGSHNTRTDVGTPRDGLAVLVVEWDGGKNASSPDFQFDIGGLIKDVVEDVLIVGYSANHLQNQLAVAHNGSSTGPIVSVLVLQTVILFVHANHVLQLQWVAFRVVAVAIKILDMAETVTSKSQLIGIHTKTSVADIKRLLAVVGGSGI